MSLEEQSGTSRLASEVGRRRHPLHATELSNEVALIGEAARRGHLGDGVFEGAG